MPKVPFYKTIEIPLLKWLLEDANRGGAQFYDSSILGFNLHALFEPELEPNVDKGMPRHFGEMNPKKVLEGIEHIALSLELMNQESTHIIRQNVREIEGFLEKLEVLDDKYTRFSKKTRTTREKRRVAGQVQEYMGLLRKIAPQLKHTMEDKVRDYSQNRFTRRFRRIEEPVPRFYRHVSRSHLSGGEQVKTSARDMRGDTPFVFSLMDVATNGEGATMNTLDASFAQYTKILVDFVYGIEQMPAHKERSTLAKELEVSDIVVRSRVDGKMPLEVTYASKGTLRPYQFGQTVVPSA